MLFGLSLMAEAAPPGPATPSSPFGDFTLFVPFLLILVVFYFLIMMPARRQEKQRQALVAALKKNDKIQNSGGIIGIVESIKDKEDELVLRGGIRITRSSVVRVVPPDDAGKEQKSGGA
jgi:preprotein translocase subunit YajC